MSEYRLTKAADTDLLQIFVYSIQTFGLARAEAYRDSLLRCFQLLAEYPRLGRMADMFAPGARRHEHARHVIFYDEQPYGVLITAIIHQRNMPRNHGAP
jgi:toxin ParE1/3/4